MHIRILCVDQSLMQEAAGISSLRPQLDQLNVSLVGIVHEELGADKLRKYFDGELYLDKEVRICIAVHAVYIRTYMYVRTYVRRWNT